MDSHGDRIEQGIAAVQLAVVVVLLGAGLLFGLAWLRGWYDDSAYHLPNAIRIARTLNPYAVPDSPVDSHWFPAGGSLPAAALIRLTGNLRLSNLTGGLCAVGLALIVYWFAGIWTSVRAVRIACVALALTVPLVLGQCLALYIDIHLAFVLLAAAFFLCRAVQRSASGQPGPSTSDAPAAGLSPAVNPPRSRSGSVSSAPSQQAWLGLAVAVLAPSIKYSGLLFAALFVSAFLFALWQARGQRGPRWSALLVLVLTALFSAGWYARNWWYQGNPVYPFCPPESVTRLLSHTGRTPVCWTDGLTTPRATWRTVLIPEHWLPPRYTPDMTSDGFGVSFLLGATCLLLALATLPRMTARHRTPALLVIVLAAAVYAITRTGREVPRYILFVPLAAALGPALLARGVSAMRSARVVRVVVCAIVLVHSAACAVNLFRGPPARYRVPTAFRELCRGQSAVGQASYDYVRAGGLRIGYLSGRGNFIAALYDVGLTNELVPLHFRNHPHNHGREYASAEGFLLDVASAKLDAIHIFDPEVPGATLLRQRFPERIRP